MSSIPAAAWAPFEDEKLCREERYPVVISIIKSNFSHCPKETSLLERNTYLTLPGGGQLIQSNPTPCCLRPDCCFTFSDDSSAGKSTQPMTQAQYPQSPETCGCLRNREVWGYLRFQSWSLDPVSAATVSPLSPRALTLGERLLRFCRAGCCSIVVVPKSEDLTRSCSHHDRVAQGCAEKPSMRSSYFQAVLPLKNKMTSASTEHFIL